MTDIGTIEAKGVEIEGVGLGDLLDSLDRNGSRYATGTAAEAGLRDRSRVLGTDSKTHLDAPVPPDSLRTPLSFVVLAMLMFLRLILYLISG